MLKNRTLFSLMFFSLLFYGEASAEIVTTQEGCKIEAFTYDPNYYFWTWNGACVNGYAQGYGQLIVYDRDKYDSEDKFIRKFDKVEPGIMIKISAIGTTKEGKWDPNSDFFMADLKHKGDSYTSRIESFAKAGESGFSLSYVVKNGNDELTSCWVNNPRMKCSNPSDVAAQRTNLKSVMETRLKRQPSNATAARDNYADDGGQPSKAGQASIANKESKVKLKGELANHCIEAEFVQTPTGEMSYFKNKCGYKVNYTWCVVNPPKESSSGMFRCKEGGVFSGTGADSIKPYGKSRVFLKGDRYHGYACKDPSTPSVRYTGDGLKGGCR